MDPVIAKTVVSRKKSISVLEAEVAALESKISTASAPAAVVVLRDMAKVKSLRLTKLRGELAALEQLLVDERQLELPAGGPGGPGRPGRR
ncbi:MAG: hypothetical protein [Arizlama microvirus]|nr:MAG: hypothetical protein [Arizlama microvirus]